MPSVLQQQRGSVRNNQPAIAVLAAPCSKARPFTRCGRDQVRHLVASGPEMLETLMVRGMMEPITLGVLRGVLRRYITRFSGSDTFTATVNGNVIFCFHVTRVSKVWFATHGDTLMSLRSMSDRNIHSRINFGRLRHAAPSFLFTTTRLRS